MRCPDRRRVLAEQSEGKSNDKTRIKKEMIGLLVEKMNSM